ncbi:MAG: amidohydrolase family protein, partial [Desulfobacterales bacterium]
RNYLLVDFLRDASAVNVVKSVHVQAEHDPSDPVRETRWLQAIADRPGSRGFPHGLVAFADFSKPNIEGILDAHCHYPNIRGIRQMLHESLVDPDKPKPALMEDAVWRRNLKLLHKYGLSFDLQVYYQQMDQTCKIVGANPDIQFVVCHTGQPARRDPVGRQGWKTGMRLLAQMPNVCVKISGLGMFDRHWTMDSLRPFVQETIETFGVDRCMFGSNFPVDGMMSSYSNLWNAYFRLTAHYSADERRQLFFENAKRVYRL